MRKAGQTKVQADSPLGDAAQISTMQLQRAGTMQAAGNFVQAYRNTPKQTGAASLRTVMQGSLYLPCLVGHAIHYAQHRACSSVNGGLRDVREWFQVRMS